MSYSNVSSYHPDYESFCELAKKSGLVPVWREIIVDLETPLTLFAKLAADDDYAFLFESMEGGEEWGRYSFIGFDPLAKITSIGNKVEITKLKDGKEYISKLETNPLDAIKDFVEGFSAAVVDGMPKFTGGAVGYLGYDMVRFMEDLNSDKDLLDLPDSSFMVPRIILVHDSFKQKVSVICWVDNNDESVSLYDGAVKRIEEIIEKIRQPLSDNCVTNDSILNHDTHEFKSNMEKDEFMDMVNRAKEYIKSGDIIQVVLSQRFHTKTRLSPINLYRALRHINPSPYLFFINLNGVIQIGSSPEILVRLEDKKIELRPIAGTRKRGVTPSEDLQLEEDLLADPKERAEHLMLVDLGRNDVGRVAEDGTVDVQDMLTIERYSHVMHIVSGVDAKIAADKNQFDVMNACFPAGTVSGAPKIRAMEIIDELELERRGPYAGAVGYFGFSGNMDFCITIRTFVMHGENLWVQAGAGIVYDSDPVSEYEETVNKSMGLRKAVELAERGF